MQLEDWLDDLCVRFIVNLPPEELSSVERICFQVEEAQWFYEDFIRPLDPALPSLSLRAFSLRIFQHCPLFSQWSAQHHTTAFAEFLAYKARVPVRGAIMLNEAMDEVVLVKGWKKGANWSFPRGKINKDENDLDCAVREVYEETGFDIRSAGLVKEERDMKYIEVTMREQHMKLFVFRGVPKDTHFEPRTRKEISKIEWYKLTDLPTLKKHKNQDSIDGNVNTVSPNKFYMVAPFLTPLKKWIAQQKRKEHRQSSKLGISLTLAEETYTHSENETDAYPHETQQVLSDLPEVSTSNSQDASSHLKALLRIDQNPEPAITSAIGPHIPGNEETETKTKSDGLLALLRGTSISEPVQQTPMEQTVSSSQPPDSSLHSQTQLPPTTMFVAPAPFDTPASSTNPLPSSHPAPRNWADVARGRVAQAQVRQQPQPGHDNPIARSDVPPYRQQVDPPLHEHESPQNQRMAQPPASALPRLTNHTKNLLDMLRGNNSMSIPQNTAPVSREASFLDLFTNMHPPSRQSAPGHEQMRTNQHEYAPSAGIAIQVQTQPPHPQSGTILQQPSHQQGTVADHHDPSDVIHPESDAQKTLLQLFGQKAAPIPNAIIPRPAPAELAATVVETQDRGAEDSVDELLVSLLKKPKPQTRKRDNIVHGSGRMPKEGETSATVDGPLNQPDFDILQKSAKHVNSEFGRSPIGKHKTLFDPHQNTPVKILGRPESAGRSAARSPRAGKSAEALKSNRRAAKESKEPNKPFQPQILRRPPQVTADAVDNGEQGHQQGRSSLKENEIRATVMGQDGSVAARESMAPPPVAVKRISQTEGHRENLLALFGKPTTTSTNTKMDSGETSPRLVSPLSTSQVLSPYHDGTMSLSGLEPISTRSRVGSITSVVGASSNAQALPERKQTGAENKTFLMGYLGRIASQTS